MVPLRKGQRVSTPRSGKNERVTDTVRATFCKDPASISSIEGFGSRAAPLRITNVIVWEAEARFAALLVFYAQQGTLRRWRVAEGGAPMLFRCGKGVLCGSVAKFTSSLKIVCYVRL
jgi:hypothetical protein